MIHNLFTIFACTPKKASFLGFPTWYEYLKGVSDANGVCSPSLTSINDVWRIALAVIDILLRVASIVAVGYIIYAGFKYSTSQGDAGKTAEAKDTIINALIGLAIAVSATFIVAFIARSIK